MENITNIVSGVEQTEFNKEDNADHITKDWYLTESAVPVTVVLTFYLAVVGLGPRLMASKKPYDLKNVMRVYNLVQVMYNTVIFAQPLLTPGAVTYMLTYTCILGNLPKIRLIDETFLINSWHYFVLKLLDLMDTVFIVLRKKNSHFTFLHVYHHFAMVFFTWYSNKYIKAQHGTIPALINMFVHSIMYTYFFLATFGPSVQKYLWWKRHLTKVQLGQFGLIVAYLFLLYLNDCEVSKSFIAIWIINVIVISAFFINFYVQTYIRKSSQLKKSS